MNSTLKTMHRCTARCGARESRFSQPSMRMLPKPSVEEKNLHVVTQSMGPPLYDATWAAKGCEIPNFAHGYRLALRPFVGAAGDLDAIYTSRARPDGQLRLVRAVRTAGDALRAATAAAEAGERLPSRSVSARFG